MSIVIKIQVTKMCSDSKTTFEEVIYSASFYFTLIVANLVTNI